MIGFKKKRIELRKLMFDLIIVDYGPLIGKKKFLINTKNSHFLFFHQYLQSILYPIDAYKMKSSP